MTANVLTETRIEDTGAPEAILPELSRLQHVLFRPVDSAFLAGFRILYGFTMLARAWYYVAPSESGNWFDKSHEYYLDPDLHFTYYGFEWVKVLPADGMYSLFVAMMLLSIFVTLGLFYRVSSVLLCLGYVYAFTIDKALFLNHYYLISLVSFLMCLIPANCILSLDAWRNPATRSDVVPAWVLWLLRAQIGIPYFYGGIAKLNSDWLHGEPMRKWLHTGFMGLGRDWLHNEYAVSFVTYGGVLFDLFIVPLLLWKRTRVLAFAAVIVFNLCNTQLFRIGVFPWFMLFGSTLFFSPEWHRRVLSMVFPIGAIGSRRTGEQQTSTAARTSSLYERMCRPIPRRLTTTFLTVYLGFQIVWPLRHHLYGGQPAWTGKGDLFAWRMMLYDKTGELSYYRVDRSHPTGADKKPDWKPIPIRLIRELPQQESRANPPSSEPSINDFVVLNGYQSIMLQRDPDLILQMCHYLAKRFRDSDGKDAEIHAKAKVSLNTRKPQWLVDPDVNLAAVPRTAFGPTPWIMPFENTPRRRLDQALHELPPLKTSPARPPSEGDDLDGPRYTSPEWE